MTWNDVAHFYDPTLTDEDINYILMELTAFPFDSAKGTHDALRSAIRAWKNHTPRCYYCNQNEPFHSAGCIEVFDSSKIKEKR